jgi:hypothetical protein
MLLTEIIHPLHRARVTTVYNCLWNLGNLGMPCFLPPFLLRQETELTATSLHPNRLWPRKRAEQLVVASPHPRPDYPGHLPDHLPVV